MKTSKIEGLILYYKKKIEHETCQSLDFEIVPIKFKSLNRYYDNLIGIASEIHAKNKSNNTSLFSFWSKIQIEKIKYPIYYMSDVLGMFEKGIIYDMVEETDVIYVPKFGRNLDRKIVNGLCTLLWHNLEKLGTETDFNTNDNEILKKSDWINQFANYGENVYFNFIKNIYNKKFTPKIKECNFSKIQKVIDNEGVDSYLKIPINLKKYQKLIE